MARLFFKNIPEGPTCSSCGYSDPRKYDDYSENYFCDKQCYVEWFVENEAYDYANALANERLFEVESRR